MHAQETTFSKIVQGEKQFQIPLYQRTCSWQREELRQLWDDVLELVEDHLDGRQPAAHFVGSVVLAPGRITAGGIQRRLVVDGQQRLTTLMLAFTALRDRHRERGADKKAARIHDLLLANSYRDGEDHYRPLPTQADRDAFTACVESSPKAGGPGNVGAAYRFFFGALTEGEESGGEAWTDAVETVLGGLLPIVEITAAEGDNVYLKRRPPFDDEPLRRELMTRLNDIDGIDLAEAKLDLRPSFPVEAFADHGDDISAVLEWFLHTVVLATAHRTPDGDVPAARR